MSSPTTNKSSFVEMGGAYTTTTDLETGTCSEGYRRRGSSNTERSEPLLLPSSPSSSDSSSLRKKLPPDAIERLNEIAGQRGGAEAIAEVFASMGTASPQPAVTQPAVTHQQQEQSASVSTLDEILSFIVPEGRSELIRSLVNARVDSAKDQLLNSDDPITLERMSNMSAFGDDIVTFNNTVVDATGNENVGNIRRFEIDKLSLKMIVHRRRKIMRFVVWVVCCAILLTFFYRLMFDDAIKVCLMRNYILATVALGALLCFLLATLILGPSKDWCGCCCCCNVDEEERLRDFFSPENIVAAWELDEARWQNHVAMTLGPNALATEEEVVTLHGTALRICLVRLFYYLLGCFVSPFYWRREKFEAMQYKNVINDMSGLSPTGGNKPMVIFSRKGIYMTSIGIKFLPPTNADEIFGSSEKIKAAPTEMKNNLSGCNFIAVSFIRKDGIQKRGEGIWCLPLPAALGEREVARLLAELVYLMVKDNTMVNHVGLCIKIVEVLSKLVG